jgi:uncharacterized membrane protein
LRVDSHQSIYWRCHFNAQHEIIQMSEVERSVTVDVPVAAAYGQWTQFEEFPRFMSGVESVEQLDERTLHWRARLGGAVREWDAVITQQFPDRRIAWRSTTGTANAGHVEFEAVEGGRTLVTLSLHYEPQGALERLWAALGMVGRRIDHDLHRFKDFMEARGRETGAWRGAIHQPEPEGTRNPELRGQPVSRSGATPAEKEGRATR